MRSRISIRGSVHPSVCPSVCPSITLLFWNLKKCLFLTAEMDANELVEMRDEAVVMRGDRGCGRIWRLATKHVLLFFSYKFQIPICFLILLLGLPLLALLLLFLFLLGSGPDAIGENVLYRVLRCDCRQKRMHYKDVFYPWMDYYASLVP